MTLRFLISCLLVAASVPRIQPATSVTGNVTDERGGAMPWAFVTIRSSGDGPKPLQLEVLADTAGRFRFEGIPAGEYRVAAHLSGFYPAGAVLTVDDTRPRQVSLRLNVAPMADCIAAPVARYRAADGAQLPTAYVTVTRQGRRARSHSLLMDGAPDCLWPETADQVVLDVLGYGEHVLKRAGEDPVRVRWQRVITPTAESRASRTAPGAPVGQIRGRVFDMYSGSIPDAAIWFQPVDPSSGLTDFRVKADARGRFDLEGVRTGTYRVECRADGYVTTVTAEEIKPGIQTEITLTLSGR